MNVETVPVPKPFGNFEHLQTISVSDFLKITGMSRSTFNRSAKPNLHVVKVSRRKIMISLASVERWIKERTIDPNQPDSKPQGVWFNGEYEEIEYEAGEGK